MVLCVATDEPSFLVHVLTRARTLSRAAFPLGGRGLRYASSHAQGTRQATDFSG